MTELEIRAALAETLKTDRVLSMPQVLSLIGGVIDPSSLERPLVTGPNLTLGPSPQLWPDELDLDAGVVHRPHGPPARRPKLSDPVPSRPHCLGVRDRYDLLASPAVMPSRLERLFVFEVVTKAVWNVSGAMVSVDAVSDWAMPMRFAEHRIGHLLGCAQVRIDLGIRPDEWHSDAAAVGETERPDAFWYPEDGRVIAVEYDTGAYPPGVVAAKVKAFSAYDGVIWACSSDRRRRRLRRTLGPLGYQVIQVDWWSPRRAVESRACHAHYSLDVVARGEWWSEV